MCLGVVLFGLILFETLCTSWTWMSVSSSRLKKFSAIMYSNMFLTSFSLSSPSRMPIMRILVCLMLSQRSLKCSFHVFFLIFSISYFHYSIFQLTDPFLWSFSLLFVPASVSHFIFCILHLWLFFIFSNSLLKTSDFSLCVSILLSSLSLWSLPHFLE